MDRVSEYLNLCFFFKQKTAYEMRISDWSSDVCSSDLLGAEEVVIPGERLVVLGGEIGRLHPDLDSHEQPLRTADLEFVKADVDRQAIIRSDARRVGKESVSTFRSRWWTSP